MQVVTEIKNLDEEKGLKFSSAEEQVPPLAVPSSKQ